MTKSELRHHLTDLVSITNRTKPGQVTHKIEEIVSAVQEYCEELIGEDEVFDEERFNSSKGSSMRQYLIYAPMLTNELRASQREKLKEDLG